jgi:ribose/xylose/arabinose/galactoside ABC-type transport system permease subunit
MSNARMPGGLQEPTGIASSPGPVSESGLSGAGTVRPAAIAGGQSSVLMKLVRSRESGVFAAFLILFGILSVVRFYSFLSYGNLTNLGVQITFMAITGIGVLFVILTSGVDLSLGSTAGLCSFVCAIFVVITPNPYLGIGVGLLAAIATGAIVGAVNGLIVSYVNVTSFIVTLGMLYVGRSAIYVLGRYVVADHIVPVAERQASAMPVTGIPDVFVRAGSGSLLGVPIPILILVVLAVVAHIILTYTVFGRRLYAIGGNEEATHLSGIDVKRVKFFSYVVCSAICGITGFLYVARFTSGTMEAGKGHELEAIAAAVIGGTSLLGGSGSVVGVILGACVMGVVSNGLDLLGVPPEPKPGIIGAVIIIAAIVDVMRNRSRTR